MLRNRRGQEHIYYLILILVGAGILMFLISMFIHQGDETSKREVCRLSLLGATKMKSFTGDPLMDLQCEPIDHKITFAEVSKKGKLDEDKLKGAIARQIFECAKMVSYNELSKQDDPYSNFEGDNKYCLLCGDVTFDKKIQKEYEGRTINGVMTWMAKHNMPGEDMTFFRYVFGSDPTPKKLNEIESSDAGKIRPDLQYTTFWRLDKDGNSVWKVLTAVGAGIAIGAFVICTIASAGLCAGVGAAVTASLSAGVVLSTVGSAAGYYGGMLVYDTVLEGKTGTVKSSIIFSPTDFINGKFPDDEDKYGDAADEYICEIVVN